MKVKLNKWAVLVGLSILPSVLGYLINNMILSMNIGGFGMFMMSTFFYMYWMYTGYKISKMYGIDFVTLLTVHLIGLLSLIFMSMQIGTSGAFMMNVMGLLPQLYFIPGLSLIARLDVFGLLNDIIKLSSVTLTVMVLVFYAGSRLRFKFSK